jgi:hypothetical protein
MSHRTRPELDAGLEHVLSAPCDVGEVTLVVRRPAEGSREILEVGELTLADGLVGDGWSTRSSRRTPDGSPHPDMQLNLVGSRVMALLADTPERRALAGDQLHVDLDLHEDRLPPGSRLRLGTAEIEVTAEPHRGCRKFASRFGTPAWQWVNDASNRPLRLRGLNARVVVPGRVRAGDAVWRR